MKINWGDVLGLTRAYLVIPCMWAYYLYNGGHFI